MFERLKSRDIAGTCILETLRGIVWLWLSTRGHFIGYRNRVHCGVPNSGPTDIQYLSCYSTKMTSTMKGLCDAFRCLAVGEVGILIKRTIP